MAREDLLAQTFVQLADTLVDDFDIIDLLTVLADRSTELLDVSAAGILLADDKQNLRVMAASSERVRLLELFQLQNQEGPCLEAISTGQPVRDDNLAAATGRWPHFAPEAISAGFHSVHAVPLRLRSVVIGALNLFRQDGGYLEDGDARLAQALADVASIAILQDQAVRDAELRAGQLQHALDSRVAIEQAKGMLAERAQLDMDEAFRRLRNFSRRNNLQLSAVAGDVVKGLLPLDTVADPSSKPDRPNPG